MSRRSVLFARLRGLLFRNRLERELDEEVQFHLEMQAEDNLQAGMDTAEARYAALRSFGGVEPMKEQHRAQRTLSLMETTINDVRYAFRTLRKSWGFAAVAVLSLALGIGGNTAIFSLLDTALLRTLPVKEPEQLVLLSQVGGRFPISYFSEPFYERIREHKEVVAGMLACFDAAGTLRVSADTPGSGGSVEMVHAQLVSGNYYSVLGVRASLGRTLTPDDDRVPDALPVAVLGYGYWQRHFAKDASVLGKTILLNGSPFTIIGVSPPEFFGIAPGTPPDITVPLMMQSRIWLEPGSSIVKDTKWGWLTLLARLRPDVPEQKAQGRLTILSQQIETSIVGPSATAALRDIQKKRIAFSPGSRGLDALRVRFSNPLLVLMLLTGLVLLVACANLAALLLARAAGRQREIGMRLALGASRGRLIRQLLTESILLATVASMLGLLFAYGASDLVLKILAESPEPIQLQFTLDMRLLSFAGALAIATGVLFGLIPALQASSPDIAPTLVRGGPISGQLRIGRRRRTYGKVLVIAQVALSLVLLVGAGLFIQSLRNLETLDPGFQRDHLLLLTVNPSMVGYREPQLSNFYQQMLSRLGAVPGVQFVSMSSHSLVSPGIDDSGFEVAGRLDQPGEPRGVNLNMVGPDFFEAVRIPIVLGRGLARQDGESTRRVAVITETLARQYFPGKSVLGKRFALGGPLVEIVGVARDTKFNTLRDPTSRVVYLPFRQMPAWHPPIGQMTFEIRTGQNPLAIAASVRRQIQEFDRAMPIVSIKTAEAQVEESLVQERLIAGLSSGFGALAMVLACIGLSGTMAHAVAQRTNEIGVRMALGAQRGDLIRSLVQEGLALVLIGAVLGIAIARAVTRLARGLLFGVTATDSVTIVSAAALLATVAAIATLLPAWKASQVDPVVALRHE
jgi:macrolide transport system ATP-binding/permease protein